MRGYTVFELKIYNKKVAEKLQKMRQNGVNMSDWFNKMILTSKVN